MIYADVHQVKIDAYLSQSQMSVVPYTPLENISLQVRNLLQYILNILIAMYPITALVLLIHVHRKIF